MAPNHLRRFYQITQNLLITYYFVDNDDNDGGESIYLKNIGVPFSTNKEKIAIMTKGINN